jgi:riboflavin synthase
VFTGIIEANGIISSISDLGSNKTFLISSPLTPEFRVDQSLSHDGICLTVESISGNIYQVTAIAETLSKTCISSQWRPGSRINLERCLQVNGRLDGHMVQGHVDATALCILRENQSGSWLYRFEFDSAFRNLIVEKGSIAVNGISLTCFDITENAFSVGIIPYTFEHTNIGELVPGSPVNIEFDLIGKYVERIYQSGRGS